MTGPVGGAGASLDGGGSPTPSGPSRYERSVRRWMNAYPRRWRVTFGEDLVATALELAEPGRRRLGLREGLALARGGWALRRRERPPWRVRMAAAGWGPLSEEQRRRHRSWLIDYVLSPWVRLPGDLLVGVVLLIIYVLAGLWPWYLLFTGVLLGIHVAKCTVPGVARFYGRPLWRRYFPDEPIPDALARYPRIPRR